MSLEILQAAAPAQQLLQQGSKAAQDFVKQQGSQVAKDLLKQSGAEAEVKKLLASSGLPPEALEFAQKILAGKGSLEDKLKAGADAAQSAINQLAGPLGAISGAGINVVTNALGLKPSAVAKVGGTLGTGAGMLVLGPIGAAVGNFAGQVIGGAIKEVFGTDYAKVDREQQRSDTVRIATFNRGKSPQDIYNAFKSGKVIFTRGKKGHDALPKFQVRGDKVVHLTPAQYTAAGARSWGAPSADHLLLISVTKSADFLADMLKVEALTLAKADKLRADIMHAQKVHDLLKRAQQKLSKKTTSPVAQTQKASAALTQQNKTDKLQAQVSKITKQKSAATKPPVEKSEALLFVPAFNPGEFAGLHASKNYR